MRKTEYMTEPSRTSTDLATDAEATETEHIDLSVVDDIVERLGHGPEAAIPILQAIQKGFGT